MRGRLLELHLPEWSQDIVPRPVEIWLPPALLADSTLRLPVIYAMDGQNLFLPERSFSGVDWGLDEALCQLADSLGIGPAIVVGIGNSPARRREYMPQTLYAAMDATAQEAFRTEFGGPPLGEEFLAWVVGTLVPAVEKRLPHNIEPARSLVLGSSRGGLIALEMGGRHPELFRGVMAMSTHWPAAGAALEDWLARLFPQPGKPRLYMDHGDQTLDAEYPPLQARATAQLLRQGWRVGDALQVRCFPGDPHHESAWRKRVALPLRWMLDPAPTR